MEQQGNIKTEGDNAPKERENSFEWANSEEYTRGQRMQGFIISFELSDRVKIDVAWPSESYRPNQHHSFQA